MSKPAKPISAKAKAPDRQTKGVVAGAADAGRVTGPTVASKAAAILADPEAGKQERSVAASTLSQAAKEDLIHAHIDRANLKNAREKLAALVAAVDALMADSLGVYGLHANGDMAPWPEVLESRFPMLAGARSIGRP